MALTNLYFLTSLLIQHCISSTPEPYNYPTTSPTIPYTLSDEGCYADFSTVGASFDLCPLKIGEARGQIKYYKVTDSRDINTTSIDKNHVYKYIFNVAGKLQSIDPICSNTNRTRGYCPSNTDCSSNTNNLVPIPTDTSWAYQLKYKNNLTSNPTDCWALSDNMIPTDVEWTLIEEQDPSLGVQLTYINGEYDNICQSNRQFNIRFECEDNILFIPDEIPLYEYIPCQYTITIPHQYGCPIQCKIYDNQVCSSNGLCAYDNTHNKSKCFCFNKYTLEDCSLYDNNAGIPDDSQKTPPDDSNPFVFSFNNDETRGVKVTYDLRAFSAPQSHAGQNEGIYIVHDKDFDNKHDRTWTYYVGITSMLHTGGDVLPYYCKDIIAPCMNDDKSTCVTDKTWNGAGLVFQANNNTNPPECYLLGNNMPSAELYDKIDDPARGVTVTYSGGSWCASANRNREFRVNLVCPREQSAVYDPYVETNLDLYEYVEEVETCVYEFTMESAVACPYQCITNTTDEENKEAFTVCTQKGICADDPEARFVRCLCDDGWKGTYCSEIDSPNPTHAPTAAPTSNDSQSGDGNVALVKVRRLIVAIVVLVLVILIVVGIGYFIYRKQKLKIATQEDEIAFHKMKDDGSNMQGNLVTDDKGKKGFATIQNDD